ncbi:hypothetical protein QQF64_036302 [Cirrhinus molitorella]|uniref:MAM domain-containing protein n=1 Tax=Cirrhinus molitorella TaxID=172907 RepID=A0ABR3NID8_9TELE
MKEEFDQSERWVHSPSTVASGMIDKCVNPARLCPVTVYTHDSSVSFLNHCSFDDESLCQMSVCSAADFGWQRVKTVSGINVTDHTYLGKESNEPPGNYWKLHHVPLNANKSFQVVFEARKGAGNSSGGFSLDDINISETECPLTWQIRDFEKILNSGPSKQLPLSPFYYSSDGYLEDLAETGQIIGPNTEEASEAAESKMEMLYEKNSVCLVPPDKST